MADNELAATAAEIAATLADYDALLRGAGITSIVLISTDAFISAVVLLIEPAADAGDVGLVRSARWGTLVSNILRRPVDAQTRNLLIPHAPAQAGIRVWSAQRHPAGAMAITHVTADFDTPDDEITALLERRDNGHDPT